LTGIEGKKLSAIKQLLKKDYVKTVIVVVGIIAVVFGFLFGLGFALGTPVPLRVVESGSMCVAYDGACNGWSHPFEQTLHVGDIIIIQAVNPADLNANYPNSDIIIYEKPGDAGNPNATPIVHRIVAKEEINGTWYFQTKGDGNGEKYPNIPSPLQYDSNTLWKTGQGVPQNLVEGKVIMRIPWFGNITLFMRDNPWSLPLVIVIIILLVIVELIVPMLKVKKNKPEDKAVPISLKS
jgi:signal peptidase I